MSTFQFIADADDPRLDPYRRIRERDLVGRDRLFVAEGELVVRMLARGSSHGIQSLLCLDSRCDRLADVAASLHGPAYFAARAILDEIAGFPVHRGVLAIGTRAADIGVDELLATLPGPRLVMALFGIANHDNVGALFRNAAAFGVDAVLLDDASCDPLYRKAIRVSVGHALRVPFSRGGSAEHILDTLQRYDFDIVALAPTHGSALQTHRWRSRTSIIVGAEGPGLPQWVLDRSRSVAIPMAGGIDSLNVATAAGIALYEARRTREL